MSRKLVEISFQCFVDENDIADFDFFVNDLEEALWELDSIGDTTQWDLKLVETEKQKVFKNGNY